MSNKKSKIVTKKILREAFGYLLLAFFFGLFAYGLYFPVSTYSEKSSHLEKCQLDDVYEYKDCGVIFLTEENAHNTTQKHMAVGTYLKYDYDNWQTFGVILGVMSVILLSFGSVFCFIIFCVRLFSERD